MWPSGDLAEEEARALVLRGAEEGIGRRDLQDLAAVHEDDTIGDACAKPISCVTQSMVMPSLARSTIVSRTSLTISGSRAEVGSSKSMIFGFMHSARAIATRCCCPPESCAGYFTACSGMRTRFRYFMAVSSASALARPRTFIGASVQFSSTVMCGKRLNCWKTMPVSCRTRSTFLPPAVRSCPSTTILPE